jgi:hypothetical protein
MVWRHEPPIVSAPEARRCGGEARGRFGIAVVSPPLDEAGNSVRAMKAIKDIEDALGANPYFTQPR